ncbi:tetratricopeptide repeat protein [Nitratifractor sp.]
MSMVQIVLLIAAVGIFYLFFRQLFSGNYPRRGIDYEAKLPDEKIGGVSRPDKTFSRERVPGSRLEEWLQKAERARKEGNLIEAKRALQNALIMDRDNPEILRLLGEIYGGMEDWANAARVYEQWLEKEPDNPHALAALARARARLGEREAARELYRRALAIEPENRTIQKALEELK